MVQAHVQSHHHAPGLDYRAAAPAPRSVVDQVTAEDAALAKTMGDARFKRQLIRWSVRGAGGLAGVFFMGMGFVADQFLRLPNLFLPLMVLGCIVACVTGFAARFIPDLPKYRLQRDPCVALLQQLGLAPHAPIKLGPATKETPLEVTVTLASGVEATLRRREYVTVSRSQLGRRVTTTTTNYANDIIALRFAPGRFPQLPAVVAALKQKLPGADVHATDSQLTWTSGAGFTHKIANPPQATIPAKLATLHGLLDPTPVVV